MRGPTISGAKLMLMTQLCLPEEAARNWCYRKKSGRGEPFTSSPVMLSTAVPELVTVTTSAGEIAPAAVCGKLKLIGVTITTGAPASVRACAAALPGFAPEKAASAAQQRIVRLMP